MRTSQDNQKAIFYSQRGGFEAAKQVSATEIKSCKLCSDKSSEGFFRFSVGMSSIMIDKRCLGLMKHSPSGSKLSTSTSHQSMLGAEMRTAKRQFQDVYVKLFPI